MIRLICFDIRLYKTDFNSAPPLREKTEKTAVERIWNLDAPGLKADLTQKIFERMDLGDLLVSYGIDKSSRYSAGRVLSNGAKRFFPDLASVVGLIPPSVLKARVQRVHKLAETCGCKLALFEQEKISPTFLGTRQLEKYLDYRSTFIVWLVLAEYIGADTGLNCSKLKSIAGFQGEADKFNNWFNVHIAQLIKLRRLILCNNNLTFLPPEIGQLTNLRFLDLEYNNLTFLPPEIGWLTNLRSLDLEYNNQTFYSLEPISSLL